MSIDWIKRKRCNWPTGSLERVLSLNGVKNLNEAVSKKMGQEPRQVMSESNSSFQEMKKIIEQIREKFSQVDCEKINPITRKKLASMPLTSIREALLWRDKWLHELKKIS